VTAAHEPGSEAENMEGESNTGFSKTSR